MASGLEAVFLGHRGALLRFVRARGAGSDAEDVMQELWLKLTSGSTPPLSDPLAYLYRMANNLLLDRHRSELRRRRREQAWSETGVEAEDPIWGGAPGERVLIAREQVRIAGETLSALGERTEAILCRFRIDGMTQSEIAEEMGISLSAVEKHLQKAYRALIALRQAS